MKLRDKLFRRVPRKNYYVVLLVSILIVIVSFYIRSLYLNYKTNNSEESIFNDKAINQIHSLDIDFALSETTEAILYVGRGNTRTIKNMEKKLFKEIENKNLNDKILYYDTNDLSEKEYIKILKDKFPSIKDGIKKGPMLIYIKDANGVDVIDSSEELIDENVLNTLLLKYGIV